MELPVRLILLPITVNLIEANHHEGGFDTAGLAMDAALLNRSFEAIRKALYGIPKKCTSNAFEGQSYLPQLRLLYANANLPYKHANLVLERHQMSREIHIDHLFKYLDAGG